MFDIILVINSQLFFPRDYIIIYVFAPNLTKVFLKISFKLTQVTQLTLLGGTRVH